MSSFILWALRFAGFVKLNSGGHTCTWGWRWKCSLGFVWPYLWLSCRQCCPCSSVLGWCKSMSAWRCGLSISYPQCGEEELFLWTDSSNTLYVNSASLEADVRLPFGHWSGLIAFSFVYFKPCSDRCKWVDMAGGGAGWCQWETCCQLATWHGWHMGGCSRHYRICWETVRCRAGWDSLAFSSLSMQKS